MPGDVGGLEGEPRREPVAKLPDLAAEGRAGAGGAEELDHGDPGAGRAEPLKMPLHLGEPDSELSAEGDGDGVLAVRPTGHDGRSVLLGSRSDHVAEGERERSTRSRARLSVRASPVSITSCVVAPQWR